MSDLSDYWAHHAYPKHLALYIPPASPAYHQQRQLSPAIIHAPIPTPHPYLHHPRPANYPQVRPAPVYVDPTPFFPSYIDVCDPHFSPILDPPASDPDDEWAPFPLDDPDADGEDDLECPAPPPPPPPPEPIDEFDDDPEDDLESEDTDADPDFTLHRTRTRLSPLHAHGNNRSLRSGSARFNP
ncbi:hypothetical protein C0992_011006, partial [Termitomyces sp. T32_za158]